jgi:hypothetical protein
MTATAKAMPPLNVKSDPPSASGTQPRSFDLSAAKEKLLACCTTTEIKAFRATLSHEQAQAVIRSIEPVQRGAILLAMHFGGTMGRGDWAGPADATIVDDPQGPPTLG